MRQHRLAKKRIESKTLENFRWNGSRAPRASEVPRAKKFLKGVRPAASGKRTIVVPIDFTEASHHGLEYALAMAKTTNSPIALVHVVQSTYGDRFVDGKSKKEIRAKAQVDARARLNALANSRKEAGARIRCIVMNGSPEYEILRIAKELKAGMIILGRQDRSPLSRLIFGSVTADIIDAANCPVLVINNGNHSSN